MIGLFRKLFKGEHDMGNGESLKNTATPVGQPSPKALAKLKIPRKFEIFIEEKSELENGREIWKPVVADPKLGGNGGNVILTVSSSAELKERQALYNMAGQRFKVLREVDPPSKEDIERLAAEQGIDLYTGDSVEPSVSAELAPAKAEAPTAHVYPAAQQRIQRQVPPPAPKAAMADEPKKKPKIVTIGDIQLKYDGDKVYQKQWIRLSSAEAANYRVISDSTNKAVPLAGKHIEARKWVLVEDSEEGMEEDE